MNLAAETEYNRSALVRVVAMLFAMVGLVRGGRVDTLPRHLRLSVLRLLRTAESALRRLAMAEARNISVTLGPTRKASTSSKRSRGKTERKPSFPMVEPLQRTGPPAPRYVPGSGPRISFFDGFDPVIEPTPEPASPDDDVDAKRLCRRLQAVQAALEDLSKCARRFAFWRARRDAAGAGRTSPLRPGRPPGHRRRGKHPVDVILADCGILMRRAVLAPNTS